MEFRGIVPYLFYDDAEAAIEWYTRAFGFVEIGRWNDDKGRIGNAEMRVGNTELWLDGGGRPAEPARSCLCRLLRRPPLRSTLGHASAHGL